MWFIAALIIGFAVAASIFWMRSKSFKLAWYEWLIGAIGLLLVLFTIQNYFAVKGEFETKAANMFLLVVGLPGLILLAVAWQLAARRQKKAE
jgi:hypothetical protein